MNKIKILLCDDMETISQYFNFIIEKESDMEVIHISDNENDCVNATVELNPDVVLLDIQMKTKDDGIKALERIKKNNCKAKIIMLTIHEEDDFIFKSFSLGADDYILKTDPTELILKTIRNVFNSTSSLRPQIAQKILSECSRLSEQHASMLYYINIVTQLTTSEFEVLKMFYQGMSHKEIAKERFVEEVTIRTFVNRILKKFGYKNIKNLVQDLKKMKILDIFYNLKSENTN